MATRLFIRLIVRISLPFPVPFPLPFPFHKHSTFIWPSGSSENDKLNLRTNARSLQCCSSIRFRSVGSNKHGILGAKGVCCAQQAKDKHFRHVMLICTKSHLGTVFWSKDTSSVKIENKMVCYITI